MKDNSRDSVLPDPYYRLRHKFISKGVIGELLWICCWSVSGTLLLLIGAFILTGLIFPFFAVPSDSMHPNITPGDLIIGVDTDRHTANSTSQKLGIVTYEGAGGYTSFNQPGDVIIFSTEGQSVESERIIHRAHRWVEEEENWVKTGNTTFITGSCPEISTCPAQQSGFLTKGDNKQFYDQVDSYHPVAPSQIEAVAKVRLPGLGFPSIFFNVFVGIFLLFVGAKFGHWYYFNQRLTSSPP